MPERPSWEHYFMEIAKLVSFRSTCLRRKVGAVLVKDKHVIATGYNGAASGLAHCSVRGCLRAELNIPSGQRHEMCRGVHAEQNAHYPGGLARCQHQRGGAVLHGSAMHLVQQNADQRRDYQDLFSRRLPRSTCQGDA